MIEYAQTVLPNVSENPKLFAKELSKCLSWAEGPEKEELRRWVIANYGIVYPGLLKEAFKKEAA